MHQAPQRSVTRHLYDDVLNRMQQRGGTRQDAAKKMHGGVSLRHAEIPNIRPPALPRHALQGTQTEISLAVMAYNLKRMMNVLPQVFQPCLSANHGES